MQKIIYYKTTSYGGSDGRAFEERCFETKELAISDAMNDSWNTYFTLYEVEMMFNGKIIEKQKLIGRIPCLNDKPLDIDSGIKKTLNLR